jgi:hypothetical protein
MVMTAAQLARLAELAALAADYFALSDPDSGRILGNAARRAEILSAEAHRGEMAARIATGMNVPMDVWTIGRCETRR